MQKEKHIFYNKKHVVETALVSTIGIILLFCLDGYEWFVIDIKYSNYKYTVFTIVVQMLFGSIIYMLSMIISECRLGQMLSVMGRFPGVIMYTHLYIRDCLITPVFGERYNIFLYVVIEVVISYIFFQVCERWKYSFYLGL